MKITAILFDLDGTLLPMDQDAFTKGYFSLLTAKLAPRGYDPGRLVEAIWTGTAAMVKNDGSRPNEAAFWETFAGLFGERALEDKPLFEEFYANEFQQARQFCGFNPLAAQAVRQIKEWGFRTALATNPIFPAVATESRMRWVGLEPSEFEWYTTYENASFCKPNPSYYAELLDKLALRPQECLMVGNDAAEDLAAQTLGVEVFLLTDCLINREGRDISACPQGGFDQLLEFEERRLRGGAAGE